jgi:hypothetical protein
LGGVVPVVPVALVLEPDAPVEVPPVVPDEPVLEPDELVVLDVLVDGTKQARHAKVEWHR